MLDDRNRVSHIYNKTIADEIYYKIESKYIIEIENLVLKLKSLIN